MLQIQPFYSNRSEYEALAKNRGLFFEALELSLDNNSSQKYNWYKTTGCVKSFHGAFIDVNPGSGDPVFREYSKKKYEESCIMALDCHAENVIFHSTCFPFLRGNYIKAWTERCVEFYYYLSEKYSNLNFFIENSMDIDPEPIKRIIDALDSKNVGVCLDIGHINYSRVPQREWFDALGERTGYLHLSDNMGIYDDHLPLGDGTVDWNMTLELIGKLPPSVPVTLEVGTVKDIEKSLRFMEKIRFPEVLP